MNDNAAFEQLKNKWNFEGDGKLTQTACATIAHVSYRNHPAILKIFQDNSDEKLSAKALRSFNNAVHVLKENEHAILIQRAMPGYHLKALSLQGNDAKATEIFCKMVSHLYRQDATLEDFPTISDWRKGFDNYLNSQDIIIPKNLVHDARDLFFKLANSQGKQMLLHGDLHHDNILFDEAEGWLVIDPKGVIGEREIEVSAYLKNPVGHPDIYLDEPIMMDRINVIAESLKLDKTRITQWCFCLTVLSCIWLIEMKEKPDDWLLLARKLEGML